MANLSSNQIQSLIDLLNRASGEILKIYRDEKDLQIEFKEDGSPVTLADRRSHELIERGLKKEFQAIPFLSEESAEEEISGRQSWERFWLCDPLDGTKEFIKRSNHFTVNLALIEKGKPTLGIVVSPTSKRVYVAQKEEGAYLIENGKRYRLKTTPVDFEQLRFVIGNENPGGRIQHFMNRFERTVRILQKGPLKYAQIAEGRADLYLRFVHSKEWDTAAFQILTEEAGGGILDFYGNPIQYNREDLNNPPLMVVGDRKIEWAKELKDYIDEIDLEFFYKNRE